MLAVFNANIDSKPDPPVGDPIKEHDPDLCVFTEAYKAREHLQKVADNRGYVLKQYGKDKYGEEGPDVACLIRKGLTIHKCEAMCMDEPWWGPNSGKKREPRVYVKLILEDPATAPGIKWKLVAVHFPPGGPKGGTNEVLHGKNKAAWAESRDRVVKYGNDHDEGTYVIVGDLNAHEDECRDEICKKLTGSIHMDSVGPVDHMLSRGCDYWHTDKIPAPYGHGWGIMEATA